LGSAELRRHRTVRGRAPIAASFPHEASERMSGFAQVSVVMGQLGERLPCQSIVEFEKSGAWIVEIDEDNAFEIVLDEPLGLLHVVSEVAPLPADTSLRTYELILQYNDQSRTTGGLRLGLSTERMLTLTASLPAVNLDVTVLPERFGQLTERVKAWRELIASAPSEAADGPRDSGAPQGFENLIRP